MPLNPGDKLGPYECVAPIGAGGMGEVYKARDTRLDRIVAIKTSKVEFSERFEREAEAVAALNHPNICQLYDVGPNYLVMEYVEGRQLKGPLPLDQTLKYAAQICDALDAAHKQGITHRDLKPTNILVTKAGIKLLDFGLAKLATSGTAQAPKPDDATLTMALTGKNEIVGTLYYMSPEQLQAQASGREIDGRSDIFSFGLVLYEMLTGKRAFEGTSPASVIAAIMERPAPSIADVAPAALDWVLKRCLEKDPDNRWQTARDLKAELERFASAPESGSAAPLTPTSWHRSWLPWCIAAFLLLALMPANLLHFRETPPVQPSLRYQIPPPGAAAAQYLGLSPDGRNLAFVANNGGPNQVWVRALDTLVSRALAGTDGATYPFWSPDGAYLGFFTDGKLKKIAVAGGPAQTLCDAASGRGGTWNRDGVILFSPGPASSIFRVPAAGGTPVPATKLAGNGASEGNRFPVFLPDGDHFIYNAGSDKLDAAGVFVGSLGGAAAVRLLPDVSNALYAPPSAPGGTGHILFRRENALMAQPFDAKGLKATGDAFPIAEQVPLGGNAGFGAFSVSENGILVFRSGGAAANRELVWIDRTGKRLDALGKPGDFLGFSVSPDEKTLAVRIGSGAQSDIWLEDIGRSVLSRFTFRPGIATNPVWSPDGSRLVFLIQTLGTYSSDIYQKPAGGNGQEELLLHSGINGFPYDWSPDGKWLVYRQTGQKTATDLWLLPFNGDHKPVPYLQSPFDELNPRFSPDGKWMAYQSNESGRFQIYVQTVPLSGAKYQISSSGGTVPRWRRDGKELFYVSADQKLTAVPVKPGATVEVGTPQPLFPIPQTAGVAYAYAPMHDGQRFLVNVPAGGDAAAVQPVTVLSNWQAGLKK